MEAFSDLCAAYARLSIDGAAAAALNNPEILETILLQLNPQTFVTSQGICRRWRSTIRTAPGIGHALFLHPEQSATTYRLNPLLEACFPNWDTTTPNCVSFCLPRHYYRRLSDRARHVRLSWIDMLRSRRSGFPSYI